MMHLDARHQLLCDHSNFIRMKGVQILPMPIKKNEKNPLIVPDKPWEEDVHLYGAVIFTDGKYKMWYYARTENYQVRLTCYAESTDGICFYKPELDVYTYHGQKTNVVFGSPLMGEGYLESDTVIYTPWDHGAEYKMLYVAKYAKDAEHINAIRLPYYEQMADEYRKNGDLQMEKKARDRVKRESDRVPPPSVYIATSSDGIHWREGNQPAVPMIDDISHLMYDEDEQEYRIYGRGFAYDESRCRADRDLDMFDGYLGRAVFMARSKDAVTWSDAVLVCTADAFDRPGDEIYSMNVFKWQKRYIGLIQMYHGAPNDMTLDIQLAVSKDGEHFERVGNRRPVIGLGDSGEWDRFNTCTDGTPVIYGDRMCVYFNGAVFRHLKITGSGEYGGIDTGKRIVRIGMGEWSLERFACASASFSGGTIRTIPLKTRSTMLHLNADSAFGSIRITFCGKNQSETTEISENGSDICIPLPDFTHHESFTVEFELFNAKLYSFWGE